ncbi:hypothetical protein SCUP234_00392 [Seiridium cupressi]
MPVLQSFAKRYTGLPHGNVAIRTTYSNYSDYERTRNTVSGAAIAGIVIAVAVGLLVCVGGCSVYSRTQKRRQQRQDELNKWHKEHPNSGAYQYGNASSAPPAAYAYGAGVDTTTDVSPPGHAHTAGHHGHHGHHGATDTSGGYASGGFGGTDTSGGASSGGGGTSGGGGGTSG